MPLRLTNAPYQFADSQNSLFSAYWWPFYIRQPYCDELLFSMKHTFLPVPKQYSCRRLLRYGQTNPLQSVFLSHAGKAPASSPLALGHSCPNANYIHFSLFRPHQYSGTDTSHPYAGTRPLAKSDYGYLVFSHSSWTLLSKKESQTCTPIIAQIQLSA